MRKRFFTSSAFNGFNLSIDIFITLAFFSGFYCAPSS